MKRQTTEVNPIYHFFMFDTRMAWLWLLVRLYVGWEWIAPSWEKLHDQAWVGAKAGAALTGFVHGALAKTGGEHPDVQSWYAAFLQNAVLPHAALWSYFVAWGELFVGLALIAGFLVGISSLFGMLMNMNYMLAGTVSVNPILFFLSIWLVLAWRISGYWGADYYALPILQRFLHRESLPRGEIAIHRAR
jgi:thiosulfate dehydrogenase (quinone) large subunit